MHPLPDVTRVSTSDDIVVPMRRRSARRGLQRHDHEAPATGRPGRTHRRSRSAPPTQRRHRTAPEIFGSSAVTVTSPYSLMTFGVMKMSSSRPHRELIAFEQRAEQRQPVQRRRAVLTRLLAADVDAADDRRSVAAHQDLRQGAPRVDRRDAVDRAPKSGAEFFIEIRMITVFAAVICGVTQRQAPRRGRKR